MGKYNNMRTILTNLSHDFELTNALSEFNIRLFYVDKDNGLNVAWNVNDYRDVIVAYQKCVVHFDKMDRTAFIYADTGSFSFQIFLDRIDKTHYKYSTIHFNDKVNNKTYIKKKPVHLKILKHTKMQIKNRPY